MTKKPIIIDDARMADLCASILLMAKRDAGMWLDYLREFGYNDNLEPGTNVDSFDISVWVGNWLSEHRYDSDKIKEAQDACVSTGHDK